MTVDPTETEALLARVRRMETIMDRVLTGGRDPEDIAALRDYFENRFLHDYEADEAGLIPADVRRGVLSEDGLYNLLAELDEEA